MEGHQEAEESDQTEEEQNELTDRLVGDIVYHCLLQICGGVANDREHRIPATTEDEASQQSHSTGDLRVSVLSPDVLHELAHSKLVRNDSCVWEIQIRTASAIYYRLSKTCKTDRPGIVSDMGLIRHVESPCEFARILAPPLEDRLEGYRKRPSPSVSWFLQESLDIRCLTNGFICLTAVSKLQALQQQQNKLLCPLSFCVHVCNGAKGVWWHCQQKHKKEYAQAMSIAQSISVQETAIVVYRESDGRKTFPWMNVNATGSASGLLLDDPANDPWAVVKTGDLDRIRQLVQQGTLDVDMRDNRGASPLLWAAGGGHLPVVRYFIEECQCSPTQTQQCNSRGFHGRTALHWAARKGHVHIVRYLVEECNVDVEARTSDGTTAFCWAAWQGHLEVMQFLFHGPTKCDCQSSNKFGCNAALWIAQGKEESNTTSDSFLSAKGEETFEDRTNKVLEWLFSIGCNIFQVNENGHSVLHKAAQRERHKVCEWFLHKLMLVIQSTEGDNGEGRDGHQSKQTGSAKCGAVSYGTGENGVLDLVRPDGDGYMPSDLAGIEGYQELAVYLAEQEKLLVYYQIMAVLTKRSESGAAEKNWKPPEWFTKAPTAQDTLVWEPWSGVSRMRAAAAAALRTKALPSSVLVGETATLQRQ